MKSFDYSHFEIQLSTTEPCSLRDVDDLRKEAARLADHAVAQYKVAKELATTESNLESRAGWIIEQVREEDWTPEQKATVKELRDAQHRRRTYDYQDDWN